MLLTSCCHRLSYYCLCYAASSRCWCDCWWFLLLCFAVVDPPFYFICVELFFCPLSVYLSLVSHCHRAVVFLLLQSLSCVHALFFLSFPLSVKCVIHTKLLLLRLLTHSL